MILDSSAIVAILLREEVSPGDAFISADSMLLPIRNRPFVVRVVRKKRNVIIGEFYRCNALISSQMAGGTSAWRTGLVLKPERNLVSATK